MLATLALLTMTSCAAPRAAAPAADLSAGSPAEASEPQLLQPAYNTSANSDSPIAQSSADLSSEVPSDALLNRKMIARAQMDLVASDTNVAMQGIESLLGQVGGYIANAQLYNETVGERSQVRGTLTLRVPAEQLERALDGLSNLAIRPGNLSVNREDVSDRYSDLDAQLRNLNATEQELRLMLAEVRAKPNAKPEDILYVHDRLMSIRGQIEQIQGQKNMMDNLIGLSTINVSLIPDTAELPLVEDVWRPGVIARDSARSLVASLQGLGSFLIWFSISVLPILLLVGIPIALLWTAWRRSRARKSSAVRAPVSSVGTDAAI
jgi:hypothetical protein